MNREDDPSLWAVMGRVKNPEPSLFFARNVVRALREGGDSRSAVAGFFRFRHAVPVACALAAVLITTFGVTGWEMRQRSHRQAVEFSHDADLESDLDVLSSRDDDSDDAAVL
ncbi:MAG: hypothetical protein M3R59_02220 [Verrucomicrobiota bacterium]|nr:hypothetical protein [Verrucomicrobiota bacterium]